MPSCPVAPSPHPAAAGHLPALRRPRLGPGRPVADTVGGQRLDPLGRLGPDRRRPGADALERAADDPPAHHRQPLRHAGEAARGGPFRFSRNPIYLADTLIYAGIALLLASLWPWLLLPVLIVFMNRTVIRHEEALLTELFGDAYRAYQARVRRWI
ncbi:methyltransferase family protein [Azotobacter sp. CWF10]